MSMFINQMLGCLIIAAGIGGAVGWLLRHVSAGRSEQLLADVTAMMHLKEQMLEKARHQLRAAASKMEPQTLSHSDEEELSSQERFRSIENQSVDADKFHTRLQESEAAGGLIEWLDIQLTERDEKHRIALQEVEQQLAERDRRIHELEQIHEQLRKQVEDNETLPTDKAA